jgi:hypothetical protein
MGDATAAVDLITADVFECGRPRFRAATWVPLEVGWLCGASSAEVPIRRFGPDRTSGEELRRHTMEACGQAASSFARAQSPAAASPLSRHANDLEGYAARVVFVKKCVCSFSRS